MSVHVAPATSDSAVRRMRTLPQIMEMKARGEKIAMLTCYDATFASVLDAADVDILLVGDSLGMVLQGRSSTLGVTQQDMVYHTRSVAAGNRSAMVMADMVWGSYQESPEQAYRNAAELMANGAQIVKLEGGAWLTETVTYLTVRGIPVCSHIGLTPQYVHQLGGYKVQGRGDNAEALVTAAQQLQAAGAAMMLFELIPAPLATHITQLLQIPTIGIGAGAGCDGQVLVLHDMLGLYPGKKARFVENFMTGQTTIASAIEAYVAAVKSGDYPQERHTFLA
jgi:3-methyl-2-oxobutanoate hydroxymethyltransferase